MARGVLLHWEEFDGVSINHYEPSEEWQRCIEFDSPVRKGAIVLHPETPECEVKLELTLSTLPSPKLVRRFRIKKWES